ncbi:MAG: M1 family metallopeptidase [Candidatus Latescibacteria bacterium]|nr:M1 family metallopeptidase [Candidatus Latescibacterota bacterium]
MRLRWGALLLLPSLLWAAGDDLRLGREVVPIEERIELRLDPADTTYTGAVAIALRAEQSTRSFRFHAEDLSITRLELREGEVQVPLQWHLGQTGLVEVRAEAALSPARQYQLRIDFANNYDTRALGLYKVETGGQAYLFTQFEAWYARQAFPCWDEPGFKIPYQLVLCVPADLRAVANTPVEGERMVAGWRELTFKKTPPLPSYLLALAVGPLEEVPIPGLSVPGQVVTTAGNTRLAAEVLRLTPPVLQALEAYFGSAYPYEKLDLIGVPEFLAGAMENPGAVTFRDEILLLDPQATSPAQRQRLGIILTHELAHMWFGDLVTMAWWDDLWLNESFADWLAYKLADGLFSEYGIGVTELQEVQWAMREDAQLAVRAIRQPVGPADNPGQLFDDLAYEKGRAVLGMFEHWMGPEPFRRGVIAYLQAHAQGNAVAGDLWAVLSREAGRELGPAMSTFLDQPGIPLVSAELLPGHRVRLRQQRYLRPGAWAPAAQWQIPVVLKDPDGDSLRTQQLLFSQSTQLCTLATSAQPAWVHANAGERGYYRWQVPPAMLAELAGHAQALLTPRERVGLIDHLAALLDGGQLDARTYLQALEGFAGDPQPEVLLALIGAVAAVGENFAAETAGRETAYARYVRKMLAPALARYGLVRDPAEAETVSLLRPKLIESLGIRGRDPQVGAFADSLALAYGRDPAAVDPALAGAALRVAAFRGDRAGFAQLRMRFEAAALPVERAQYLDALGRFADPQAVEAVLEYVLSGPLRPQEYLEVPFTLAEKVPSNRDRVFAWMQAHYATLAARIPPEDAAYLPWLADGASPARLEAAQRFFADPAHAPAGTEKELEKMTELVHQRLQLREREGRAVSAYLEGLR